MDEVIRIRFPPLLVREEVEEFILLDGVAQGAAVGDVISSEISRIAKELPTAVAGLDPSRIRQKVEDEMDHLLDCIAKALEQLEVEPVKPSEGEYDDA